MELACDRLAGVHKKDETQTQPKMQFDAFLVDVSLIRRRIH